jgi:hypothetical protein
MSPQELRAPYRAERLNGGQPVDEVGKLGPLVRRPGAARLVAHRVGLLEQRPRPAEGFRLVDGGGDAGRTLEADRDELPHSDMGI